MKNYLAAVLLLAALVFLPGASIWEGAAAVSMDFPDSGFYVATNSFPRNSVVDLTNLETGKTVRVIVAAGLDTPGLLALVSREAAEAVGLRSRTIGRIRMMAPSDPIAYSRFSEEYRSGDPDYDPLAAVEGVYGKDTPPVPVNEVSPPDIPDPDISDIEEKPPVVPSTNDEPIPVLAVPSTKDEGPYPDNPLRSDPESAWAMIPEPEPVKQPEPIPEIAYVPEPPPVAPPPPPVIPPPVIPPVEDKPPAYSPKDTPEYNYTLIPAEERPPQGGYTAPAAGMAPQQIFSVPVVSGLERGKYYLQIGAYSQVPTVEQELSKVERSYPLIVQCIGSPSLPIYRILIGPVNQGEATAFLRKFQVKGYKDAFVRRGE